MNVFEIKELGTTAVTVDDEQVKRPPHPVGERGKSVITVDNETILAIADELRAKIRRRGRR